MESTTDILNELKSLSPLLAGMDKVNVFTVPPGYFNSISMTVLAGLREDNSNLDMRNSEPLMEVPEGYFDQLASAVLTRIKAGESSGEETMNLSPLLHGLKDQNVFEVPVGYFKNFASNIINRITITGAKEELKNLSPLLAGIQNKPTFEVPAGYFAGFADGMIKKLQTQLGKVSSMRNRNRFLKYAVAAMLTGVTALGLSKYLDQAPAGITHDNNSTSIAASVETGKKMNDLEFTKALERLTNADIAKYLERNADIADVAVLNNNVDESTLPSQEDYLADDATLENYLKEIEKTTINN
ncbi:MAG: hypothetical protein WKI04_19785 [Ferruginibacter sp.]